MGEGFGHQQKGREHQKRGLGHQKWEIIGLVVNYRDNIMNWDHTLGMLYIIGIYYNYILD